MLPQFEFGFDAEPARECPHLRQNLSEAPNPEWLRRPQLEQNFALLILSHAIMETPIVMISTAGNVIGTLSKKMPKTTNTADVSRI